ncbi:hypothetical protein ACIOD1_31835 [Streptomyces sp. NPDC088097]|uniref:hypothetical protein n=1 Tax=Streptomyces sp. NPDC088097 TaxID=3365823 RepID=UPI0037F96400
MVNVDAVMRELYGLVPAEFTAARDAHVSGARKEGRTGEAKQIAALRKPGLAVWAANLLARHDPGQAARLLKLGEGLREAHRNLDGAVLRDLSHQQHGVIGAMVREAARLAGQAGQDLSESVQRDLVQTLHGVLSDPKAGKAWREGVLAKAPDMTVGFTDLEPAPGTTPSPPPPPPLPPVAARSGAGEVPAPPRPTRKGEGEAARQSARAEARRAAQVMEKAERALEATEKELEQARAGLTALDKKIADLREQLGEGRRERARLQAAEQTARKQQRAAGRAAHAAHAESVRAHEALGRGDTDAG